MKFAIISDIHGNIEALKVVIDHLEKQNIDRIIWCGDYVTDMPNSREVLELMKEVNSKYKHYIVKGNREDYIIDYVQKGMKLDMDNINIVETYNNITSSQYKYLKSLSDELIIEEEGFPKIYLSHKNNKTLEKSNCEIQVCGHTHISEIDKCMDTTYINPGSVGIPNGYIGTEYMLLEIDNEKNIKTEVIRLSYDKSKTIDAIKKSNNYEEGVKWGKSVIKSIETGLPFCDIYVKKAREIYGKNMMDISNVEWEFIRKEVGIE